MELGAHSPSFLISIRIQKGKETWSHTTFQGLVISSNLGPSSPATLALMVLTTLLGSAFGLVLTWAQVSEDKVGAGLAKAMSFLCVVPLRLSCSSWSFMGSPIFELVVGY